MAHSPNRVADPSDRAANCASSIANHPGCNTHRSAAGADNATTTRPNHGDGYYSTRANRANNTNNAVRSIANDAGNCYSVVHTDAGSHYTHGDRSSC
jgi:hypothetical protein